MDKIEAVKTDWNCVLGGLSFSPGILWGFVGIPRDFFGFLFCPHMIIPVNWNPEYSPRPPRHRGPLSLKLPFDVTIYKPRHM